MKNMNMKKRYWTMNLQVFAGDGGDDDPGDEGGDDDDDSDDDDEPEENEKKFSQKDVDDAVKKRLAREKRKWQREQQKKAGKKPNGKVKTGESSEKEDDDTETQELRDKAAKADEMEMKWTCLEHDVDKACVDDVLALARVHMAKDEDMDIEDAIDEVLKKYPQFKAGSSEVLKKYPQFKESSKDKDEEDDEEESRSKSWGQRQNGRRKKMSGVEAAFYSKNPGLKDD